MALPTFGAVPRGPAGRELAGVLHVLGYSMNASGACLMAWCWHAGVFNQTPAANQAP